MASLPLVPPVEVGVREARAHFSAYLEKARAGTPVIITTQGKPDVEIRLREQPTPAPRQPGWLIGTEWEHFEAVEWSQEELDEMFSSPIEGLD